MVLAHRFLDRLINLDLDGLGLAVAAVLTLLGVDCDVVGQRIRFKHVLALFFAGHVIIVDLTVVEQLKRLAFAVHFTGLTVIGRFDLDGDHAGIDVVGTGVLQALVVAADAETQFTFASLRVSRGSVVGDCRFGVAADLRIDQLNAYRQGINDLQVVVGIVLRNLDAPGQFARLVVDVRILTLVVAVGLG